MPFVPGWSHSYAVDAEARMLAHGTYATVLPQATKPRPAVSLSHLRARVLEQGSAGTCWATSPAMLFSITAKSLGFEEFPACRRLIAWEGKRLEGGGNPADGGSPTDAIRVMTSRGVGVAHESLLPYTDDRDVLARRPPQSVFDDAKTSHLHVPIAVRSFDQIVGLIDGQNGKVPGLPVVNGFQAPVEMQSGATFVGSIGGFLGGHSETCVGFISPGIIDDEWWLQLENHWGPMYAPLPPSVAKHVCGYEPATKGGCSSNWIRRDVYLSCCRQGCEHVSATSIDGMLKSPVVVASDDLAARIADIFIA